jgi:homoserine dehydrogenase
MKLTLIGFGTVGQGLAEILAEKGDWLASTYGLQPRIVAVADSLKGSLYQPEGLNLPALLAAARHETGLASYPEGPGLQRGWDSLTSIRQAGAEVLVEVAYTNLQTGQPALDHLRTALGLGQHVVTTNKGPIALAYEELQALAAQKGCYLGFEGTVMSGTPAIRLAQEALAGCQITEIKGILNGTTNYILSQMEQGQSYAEALKQAQALGYAEADPTGDVEGFDTMGKLMILARALMGVALTPEQVDRQGISHLSSSDVQVAASSGERWKLIGHLQRVGGGVRASVKPSRLSQSHPLAAVHGATNAISYTTDFLGDVTLVGVGAGRRETGFALLSDLLAIHRRA